MYINCRFWLSFFTVSSANKKNEIYFCNFAIPTSKNAITKKVSAHNEVVKMLEWLWPNQCDQIGRFSKVLGNKFYYKSSPNIWWLWHWGNFEQNRHLVKIAVATFWAILGYLSFQHLVTLIGTIDRAVASETSDLTFECWHWPFLEMFNLNSSFSWWVR